MADKLTFTLDTGDGENKDVVIKLRPDLAPGHVERITELVGEGFYDGVVFHRVIPGFMAQAGGHTPDYKLKESDDEIPNESGNGLQNLRGTIAMARTGDPHSAGSQFFINVADNVNTNPATANLDPTKHRTQGRWGYAVFGFVFEGMEVVDKIVNAKTVNNGPGGAPAPVVPIIVNKMSLITYD